MGELIALLRLLIGISVGHFVTGKGWNKRNKDKNREGRKSLKGWTLTMLGWVNE